MESIDETATESTHDETLTKIHHQLVLYVKEKEQIDELRYTQAKLAEATESLGKQISKIENEHKDRNRSRREDRRFAYYARFVDIWRHEDQSWKMPTTVEGFEQEVKKQQETYAKRVEERDEATRQQEKWKKEIEAKLQQDIKRVREQQVAELRARKRQAK